MTYTGDPTPLPRSPAGILTELEELRTTIAAADEARDRRLALWLHARTMDVDEGEQRLTFARLAAAAGVAEPYVIREVGKAKPKQSKVARAAKAS